MKRRINKSLIILALFFIMLLCAALLFLIFNSSFFVLRNIEITKNFNIENEKIINYLSLYPLRHIWEYDKKNMLNKLSRLYYLGDYKVNILLPNTISFNIKIREPFCRVAGRDGRVYVIDKSGVIFRMATGKDDQPLLIYEKRDMIYPGVKLMDKYMKIIINLNNIKNNDSDLFESISQVDIIDENLIFNYFVSYKTLTQRIYLKNHINVDSIRRGLACVLILNKRGYDRDILSAGDSMFSYEE